MSVSSVSHRSSRPTVWLVFGKTVTTNCARFCHGSILPRVSAVASRVDFMVSS